MKPIKDGILQRIKAATSPGQVLKLVDESVQYRNASPSTKRRWSRAAGEKMAMLSAGTV